MAAPIVSVFLPEEQPYEALLRLLVENLNLKVDDLPPDFPCSFSAQRFDETYFLITYIEDGDSIIDEILKWDRPAKTFKQLLQGCRSYFEIHYRSLGLAKKCLCLIAAYQGKLSSQTIIENGHGCLLRLSDVAEKCLKEPAWTWERESFPDLTDVADSEWIG